jgi:gliding motility-associated-like protein
LRRTAFLILILVSSPLWLLAAHLKGGYIEYKYIGPTPGQPGFKRYLITVYQYLDCASAGGQIDENVFLGVFNSTTNQILYTTIVPLGATKIIQKRSFDCIENPPVVCYRIDSYSTIEDFQDNSTGYTLSVQRCCRIAGINNVANSSNTGVTYTIKINASSTGGTLLMNSSPIFSQSDTALVCAKNGFTFPFKATDPDNDSLVYSFTAGLNTPTREAKPNPPFNPPFPELTYAGQGESDQPMGATVGINSYSGIISGIAPAQAGDYVVAVLVGEYRNGVKVAETRKEIHITVGNCNVPRATLPANIINCNDFQVLFENQSYAPGINSYYWEFGVPGMTSDTSTLPKPNFTYPDTGVFKAKLVVNRGGACPDSTVTDVKIFPGFSADFSYLGVCRLLPYQFKDESKTAYGTVNSWRWNFGDPASIIDTSIIQHPAYTYQTNNTYQVSLIASSSKGCIDTVTKQVIIVDKPSVNLAFRDTLICKSDSVQLQATGPGNYSWTPGINIINASTASPIVFPKATTVYHVTLDNAGCNAFDSVRVSVVDFITVDAGPDTIVCRGDGTQLLVRGEGRKFLWSPATFLNDPTSQTPVATIQSNGITYTVNASLGSCTGKDAITIVTSPYPFVVAGSDTTVCFGQPALLHGSTNAPVYHWTPARLVENSNSLETTGHPESTQLFVLTANNTTGCTKPVTDTVLVNVIPQITVFAGNDTAITTDQPLQLNATTSASSYRWSPSTGLNNPDILNPVILITRELAASAGEYLHYVLTVTASQGCTSSDEIVVRLFKTRPSIFIPSGFTPNGDGKNDIIRPVLAGIKLLDYFRIYNRYGQLIFETRTPGAGWDGTLKGQPQQTGTFVYNCRATDYLGNKAEAKGTFVLIR